MTLHALTAKRLHEWQRRGDDLKIIDVLPEGTYEDEHIPGAANVPLGDGEFETRVREFTGEPDSETKVVVYCANAECDLSPRAADRLATMGFHQVFDLQGGIDEWKDEGYPTESGGEEAGVRLG